MLHFIKENVWISLLVINYVIAIETVGFVVPLKKDGGRRSVLYCGHL